MEKHKTGKHEEYLEISKSDLAILTKAIMENFFCVRRTGAYQSEQDQCLFCGHLGGGDDIKDHEHDCPVLVARSII